MTNNKPILFCDFDGVLCHDRYWRSLPTDELEKIQSFLFGEDDALVVGWMRGNRTAEEVNQMLADQTGISYEKLWNVFVKDCESMHVSNEVLEKLDSLRSVYTVILVTSNMDSFSRFTEPATGLKRYFDHISNSFDEGILKTDNNGELYLRLVDKYQASIEDSVVFDDSKNVQKIFTGLGGTAYLVTKEQDLAFHLENLPFRRASK